MWHEVLNDGTYSESLMPINYVMLSVLAGIIGLVLGGFTGWHILLAARGQTTIECLEKTRYLSPLRKSMQHLHIAQHQGHGDEERGYGQQLMDIHTNALPGVTRPEEGEQYTSQAGRNLPMRQTYEELERARARERYDDYLDEQDSKKMPNAFDLGWRRNLGHIFGPNRLLWSFPIQSTTGDGWIWDPSPKWLEAQDTIRKEREAQAQRERDAGWGTPYNVHNGSNGFYDAPLPRSEGAARHYVDYSVSNKGRRTMSKADKILGRDPSQFADAPEERNIRPMHYRERNAMDQDGYDSTSDDEESSMS